MTRAAGVDPAGSETGAGARSGAETGTGTASRPATGAATGLGGAAVPARGRPRSRRAQEAVLDAATELLLTRGLSAVTMDTVAEHAGVSKATIYRWWPTKESLALDALFTEWAKAGPAPRDTGTLRGDLLSLMRPWVRLVGGRPYGAVIAQLVAAAHADPVFAAEYRRRVFEPRRELARAVFHRAIDRGEIPAGTKVDVALDLIYGPLYHRLLHQHAPLNERFARDVVDTVLAGLQARGTSAETSSLSAG